MRVLVFGTFDHFHQGHAFLLREAEKRGDVSVVVARDATAQLIKGHPPDESQEQRLAGVKKAFPKAEVLLGDAEDYLVPVRQVKPDLILLGYDQALPPGVTMEDLPCPVERAPAFKPETYKSSRIRKARKM